jgi:hypothetical protein
MNQVLFAVGLVVVVLNGLGVLFTMGLPHRPSGLGRISMLVNRSVRLGVT